MGNKIVAGFGTVKNSQNLKQISISKVNNKGSDYGNYSIKKGHDILLENFDDEGHSIQLLA
jgi:hypothetical protein